MWSLVNFYNKHHCIDMQHKFWFVLCLKQLQINYDLAFLCIRITSTSSYWPIVTSQENVFWNWNNIHVRVHCHWDTLYLDKLFYIWKEIGTLIHEILQSSLPTSSKCRSKHGNPSRKHFNLIWYLKCAPRWKTIQNLNMYWHWNNTRKCQYIGWFFIFSHIELKCKNDAAQKYSDNHG